MNDQKNVNVTRGYGVLENFLSRQRGQMADCLIPNNMRQGKILDIGCGTLPLFLKNVSFKEKYGLDKIDDQSQIRPELSHIRFVRQDFEGMPTFSFKDDFLK
jgi:hypothetical protein